MCRMFGFRSAIDSSVHRSLVSAEDALAELSERHRDGWGIAHYIDGYPHVIRNDEQALADVLFRELSGVVATQTFLAHIRLATAGSVRVLNCHPFQYGRWAFAHNGDLPGWKRPSIRERVINAIDARFRRFRLGDTDSEAIFYVFLSHLARRVEHIHHDSVGAAHLVAALRETLDLIRTIAPDDDEEKPNRLTVLLTNGTVMLGYRDVCELYYSTHKARCPEREKCYAYEEALCERSVGSGGIVKHLVVSSEPISDGPNIWYELSRGDYVCLEHGMCFQRGTL